MISEALSSGIVFKVALTINLLSVIYNIINDCDETYNYWEPLHFLIYGNGFQTWEYSPTYALRSYIYLILYGWPAIVLKWVINWVSKRILFYLIRIYMSIVMSYLEMHLFKSINSYLKFQKNSNLAIYSVSILIFSAGSFISSTAFLPSSFAFYCSILTLSSWIRQQYTLTISSVAISAILGWPFSAAIGLPFAIDIAFVRKSPKYFLKTALLAGLILGSISLVIDSFFYGQITLPAFNIIRYNVLGGQGPELYGTEPASFYLRNYLLNFNLVMIFVPIFPIVAGWIAYRRQFIHNPSVVLGAMAFSAFMLWNIIFFAQPHKEERFLFPCYPFLAVFAGFCLDWINRHLRPIKLLLINHWTSLFIIVFTLLSASRVLALIWSFRDSMAIYERLQLERDSVVCVGREWYRFPSSFLLGDGHGRLAFLHSEFQGQLPARFTTTGVLQGTRTRHNHFNDQNRHEEHGERFMMPTQCAWIVDKGSGEPNWAGDEVGRWRIAALYRIRDTDSLGDGSLVASLFRAFMVLPTLFETRNVFVDYQLWQQVPLPDNSNKSYQSNSL